MAHQDPELGATIAFLRRLVTLLTVTMILGILAVTTLLVIRLNAPPDPLALPERLELEGIASPTAVTFTPDHILVVGQDQHLHIFSRADHSLIRSIPIE